MRTMSLRGLSRDAPTLTDAVLVTHENQVIGRFIPIALDGPDLLPPQPRPPAVASTGSFNTRPFTPVPKSQPKRK